MAMYKDIIEVTIDLRKGFEGETPDGVVSTVKQCDNLSRVLRCRLKNKDRLINLKDSQLFLYVTKPDNTLVMIQGEVSEKSIGFVDFTLTRQALAMEGIIICEIVQLGLDKATMSFSEFSLKVVKTNISEDVVESSNEFTALSEALVKAVEWESRFENGVDSIEQKVNDKLTEVGNNYTTFESNKQQEFTQFITNKGNDFNTQKQEWDRQFQASEQTRQQKETERIGNEEERKRGYTAMNQKVQEIYSSTLKYRIID